MAHSDDAWADDTTLPVVEITATRLGDGVAGTSTSLISAADIARDPAGTIADIVGRQAGVQVQSLYGGVDGAGSTISLRGFGATASQNSLVLLNGRRVNDPDQSIVDLSGIPLDSVERIEITRGNSGAVLYGDGAVGGVINIVTKSGAAAPSMTTIDLAYGSFKDRAISASTNQRIGADSIALFASDVTTDGYRDNNALREKSIVAEFDHALSQGNLYVRLQADDQDLGLPGELAVAGSLSIPPPDPKVSDTPYDFGNQQVLNLTLGGTWRVAEGIDLTVDGGLRHKEQQSSYASFYLYDAIDLTTASLTPRLTVAHSLFGWSGMTIVGVDVYDSVYAANYSDQQGDPSYDRHTLRQRTVAVYGQESLAFGPQTTVALGLRLQQADIAARERTDPAAPGGAFLGSPGTPLNATDSEYAAHLGVDQGVFDGGTLFARVAHSFRMPNIDDRNYVIVVPTNFQLKTQTSIDGEFGLHTTFGRLDAQLSAYTMQLRNEIDYDPGASFGLGANVNLDPTRRSGIEASGGYRLTDGVHLTGNVTYTDARYRGGPYSGNQIAQVAAWTGNVGLAWDLWPKWALLDIDARLVGDRRLGDDLANTQPREPAYVVADAKISGSYRFVHWSLAVRNLADAHYFDQGFVGYQPGTSMIYPMPGRSYTGRVGVRF